VISGKPSHLVVSLTFLRRLLASCLKICFTKTPRQRNFAPSFISASRTSSPSWLIPVKFFTSITRPRPSRLVLAFSHAVRSSFAQGAMSLPSQRHAAFPVLIPRLRIRLIVDSRPTASYASGMPCCTSPAHEQNASECFRRSRPANLPFP
jgi:hypothetical protein